MQSKMVYVYITLYEDETYKKVFDYFCKKCNNFYVIFPYDPNYPPNIYIPKPEDINNPLLVGKTDFLKLKDIEITLWEHMKHGIKISSSLSKEAIQIFRYHLFEQEYVDRIYWYSFLKDEQEIFEVCDGADGILNISEKEFKYLLENKIITENDIGNICFENDI